MFSLKNEKTRCSTRFAPLLLLFSGFMFSNGSLASIGKVIYEYGDNYAFDFDGNRRDLEKGTAIAEGDTLVTGAGRMQVRLIDGGLISVYPNSEYKIEKFQFASAQQKTNSNDNVDIDLSKLKESKTDRGFFNLLKGAARQVTGALGRKYNDNFKFKSTIATVGIRGTGFFVRVCQADCFDKNGIALQDGMYVKNNVGIITMENNAGSIALAQGQAAFASSSEDAPVQTDESPAASGDGSSDEIETFDFDGSVSGNSEITLNKPENITVPPVTPPTIVLKSIDYTFIRNADEGGVIVGAIDLADPENIVVQTGDEITGFTDNIAMPVIVFDKGDAMLEESGMDANYGVMWNRWQGTYSLSENGVAVGSLDPNLHVIGASQLTQNVLSLAPKGDVEYVGTGATSPTLRIGNTTLIGTQTFHAGLNFSGAIAGRGIELGHLTIATDFGDMQVDMHIDRTLDLTTANGMTEMHGYCRGCRGVGLLTEMNGSSTVNMVGDNAEAIFGSYNLTGDGADISGTYIGTEEN